MKVFIKFLLIISIISMFTLDSVMARAGGSGGRSSSSSSSSRSSSSSSSSSRSYSSSSSSNGYSGSSSSSSTSSGFFGFLFFIVFFGIFIFIFIKAIKGFSKNVASLTNGNSNSLKKPSKPLSIPADIPQEELIARAKKAFMDIQVAWQNKNIESVRRFISDGVYQRFNTQFIMMNRLEQTNEITYKKINSCIMVDTFDDGMFDGITYKINATMIDTFKSKKYKNLNESGNDTFNEFWTFIRKMNSKGGDMYNTPNCPNCGGDLSHGLGELSKCPYCDTLTNGGDFDWVLTEISQEGYYDMYESQNSEREAQNNWAKELRDSISDTSVQLLEDKVSNAFFQIKSAEVLHDSDIMRRFVTDDLFNELEESHKDINYFYNRIFINSVNQKGVGVVDENNFINVDFEIVYAYERVIPEDGFAKKVDNEITEKKVIYTLSHENNSNKSKGNLYGHECPSCGAPIEDSSHASCSYCGTLYNSGAHEWVVSKIS